jgi:hypothetical protein
VKVKVKEVSIEPTARTSCPILDTGQGPKVEFAVVLYWEWGRH